MSERTRRHKERFSSTCILSPPINIYLSPPINIYVTFMKNLQSTALWPCTWESHLHFSKTSQEHIKLNTIQTTHTIKKIGIVTGVLVAQSVARIPTAARSFSPLQNAQTGIVAHPASYSVGIADFFTTVKWLGRKANNSMLSNDEIKHILIFIIR